MLKLDAGSAGSSLRYTALGSDEDLENEGDAPADHESSGDDLRQIAPVSSMQQIGSASHGSGPLALQDYWPSLIFVPSTSLNF